MPTTGRFEARPTLIEVLERRGVITTAPERATECCGLPRDEDGFCTYRPGHPIYVDPVEARGDAFNEGALAGMALMRDTDS